MGDLFGIVPAPPRAMWFLGAIIVLLVAILVLLAYITYASQATRFAITPDGLSIRGTMYGRTLAWSQLRVDDAEVVDLTGRRDLQPTLRSNGVGLPGYRAGWFRLRSGRGLLFVTDPSSVVVVPTTEGYTLMVSVAHPDRFVESLRRAAESPPPARF